MDKLGVYNFTSDRFFPETYVMNYTSITYKEDELDFLGNDPNDQNIWIYKPVTSSRGRGIDFFNYT